MKAIVTLCTLEADSLGKVTHPLLKAYADKTEADFVIISEPKLNLGNHNFEKFQIYDLLEKYERIVYVDTDVIITPDCPNLFNIVPEKEFGAFVVSKHTYFHDGAIKKIQEKLGDIGWTRTYFNAGVMVISQSHRQLFSKECGLLEWSSETGSFYDQTLFSYNLQKQCIPIYDIGYEFNHTTDPKNSRARFGRRINQMLKFADRMLSSISPKYKKYQEEKSQSERYIVHYQEKEPIKHRFHSYIIHYTGKGHRQQGSKIEQIQKDLSIMNNKILANTICWLPFLERFV